MCLFLLFSGRGPLGKKKKDVRDLAILRSSTCRLALNGVKVNRKINKLR